MAPSILKTLWRVIEITPADALLTLDDSHLLKWLQEQVSEQYVLNPQEQIQLKSYLKSRVKLIRDVVNIIYFETETSLV